MKVDKQIEKILIKNLPYYKQTNNFPLSISKYVQWISIDLNFKTLKFKTTFRIKFNSPITQLPMNFQ